MKHTPTAEELEKAIVDLLDSLPKSNLTAKEIRDQLLNSKKDWTVPGERRIAKFVKRQKNSKKTKNGIFRIFKGSKGNDNNLPLESYPGSKSEDSSVSAVSEVRQKKVGFRPSVVTRLFSPVGRRKKSNKSVEENSQRYDVPEEDRPVFKPISEVEESAHYQVDEDDYEILTPVQAARLYTVKPLMPSPVKEEKEVVKEDGEVIKDSNEESTPDEKPVGTVASKSLEEVYVDDNDGKKGNCNCEGCIIL